MGLQNVEACQYLALFPNSHDERAAREIPCHAKVPIFTLLKLGDVPSFGSLQALIALESRRRLRKTWDFGTFRNTEL